jgi:hypothetical protein
MNPARSFGPDLAIGNLSTWWVCLVGPVAGAVIAVGVAYALRGPAKVQEAAAAGTTGPRNLNTPSVNIRSSPLVPRARGLAGLLPCRRRQAGWHPLAAVGFARDWSPDVMDLRRGNDRGFP